MKLCRNYHRAIDVPDALAALASAPQPARPVAGGTDMLLELRQGKKPPVETLVDITGVPEMCLIEHRGEEIFLGAAVPHNQITSSALLREHTQALVQACGLIGGPQVRNIATLGGNVAHALPAADGTIALFALDAQAEVASKLGRRRVKMDELFKGPGESALIETRELLVGFYLPLRPKGSASAFHRVMRPQGVAIAILNMALWLQREDDHIVDIRLSAGPVGRVPRRLQGTEDAIRGLRMEEVDIPQVGMVLLDEVSLRTSRHRATSEYRKHLAVGLLKQTLSSAWQQANLS